MSLIIGAVRLLVGTVSAGLQMTIELSGIGALRVYADAADQCVVVECADDDAAIGVLDNLLPLTFAVQHG